MSQLLKPCCENTSLEMVDAPRTEGAIPPTDVIRCTSCGSVISAENISSEPRINVSSFIFSLADKIGFTAARPS